MESATSEHESAVFDDRLKELLCDVSTFITARCDPAKHSSLPVWRRN
jgi:hypothetical protein